MFGQNKLSKRVTTNPNELVVTEIFPTLQGEGPYSGMRSVFVRLQGCHLRCWFCDTDFDSGDKMSVKQIVGRVHDLYPGKPSSREPGLVVLTGGEPTRQPITNLVDALITQNFIVQIETAGSFYHEIMQDIRVPVVVSPKTPTIDAKVAELASCFKYVISFSDVLDPEDGLPVCATQRGSLPRRLARPRKGAPVYLSPCDEYDVDKNLLNLKLVRELALQYGYRAGVQLHKLLQLP